MSGLHVGRGFLNDDLTPVRIFERSIVFYYLGIDLGTFFYRGQKEGALESMGVMQAVKVPDATPTLFLNFWCQLALA